MRRSSGLWAAVAVVSCCTAAGLSGQEAQQKGEEAATAQAVHRRIEAAAADIEAAATALRAASEAPSVEVRRDAVTPLQETLDALRAEVHRLPPELRDRLESKLWRLQRRVQGLGRPRPAGFVAEPQRAEPARPAAKSVVASDECAGAQPILLGDTVLGDTTGATQDGGSVCGGTLFSPDVWYRFDATESGSVSVDTLGSSFDTVLSVHRACPGSASNQYACNDDLVDLASGMTFFAGGGLSYWIRVAGFDGAVGGFALHLGIGAEVTGTVRDEATGDPIEGGVVELWNEDSPYAPRWTSDPTGSDGTYTISASGIGDFRVRSSFLAEGYEDEAFDDVPCPHDSCAITDGDRVVVPSTGTISSIDFELGRGSSIEGSVREASSGDALGDVEIRIYSGISLLTAGRTDAGGHYRITGLGSGPYFATAVSPEYRDVLYDDMQCDSACDPRHGTVIEPPQVDGVVSGIDFNLERLGEIDGRVARPVTGEPVAGASVQAIPLGESFVAQSATTETDGSYSVRGLKPGRYLVKATQVGFQDDFYENPSCDGTGCGEADATPVQVTLNETVTSIDITLDHYGKIIGTVVDESSGAPLAGIFVQPDALAIADRTVTDGGGHYEFPALAPREYVPVTTGTWGYVDEASGGVPCFPNGCFQLGVPVYVPLETTTVVDFALSHGGTLSGAVVDGSGAPIAWASVAVWEASGTTYQRADTVLDGSYSVGPLASGTYFVTGGAPGFIYELYDDLPCALGCDVTTGTPIGVYDGATTDGIDFALASLGGVEGQVTVAGTGDPVAGLQVDLIGDSSSLSVRTDFEGHYRFQSLPGRYFVATRAFDRPNVVYDGIPCLQCDPRAGTPLTVVAGQVLGGIDLALPDWGELWVDLVSAETSEPVVDAALLFLYGPEGTRYAGNDGSGRILFSRIAGPHHLIASASGYIDEVYDNISCRGDCDPTKGTPIDVPLDTTIEVRMALLPDDALGIAGRVTAAATGGRLSGIPIDIWNQDGTLAATTTTVVTGDYFVRLDPGTYFVSTDGAGLFNQVYPGIPCNGTCVPGAGTPIVVPDGFPVGHVDFALGAPEAIFTDGFESGNVAAWSSSVP